MIRTLRKSAALVICLCMLSNMTVQAREISSNRLDYSAVFDAEYYYKTNQDVQKAIGNDSGKLLEHFLASGMKEGRIAKADFDVRAYMKNNIDLIPVLGIKDYSAYYNHYIKTGKSEGRIAVNMNPSGNIDEIGSFSTQYNMEEDRAVNVELASDRINGMVIQPGDTFSFSNSVLSRTLENGYVVAPSFASGRIVTSVGGGICQVSSTLYVAMVLSSLPATERYAHSLAVDYVPTGLDSAIVEGVKDLKFKNVHDYPVCINSTTKDGTLTISISKAANS